GGLSNDEFACHPGLTMARNRAEIVVRSFLALGHGETYPRLGPFGADQWRLDPQFSNGKIVRHPITVDQGHTHMRADTGDKFRIDHAVNLPACPHKHHAAIPYSSLERVLLSGDRSGWRSWRRGGICDNRSGGASGD